MQKPSYHAHPVSGIRVYGILIEPGMRLWASDLFANLKGEWEPSPFSPGVTLLSNDSGEWVRPIPEGVTSSQEYIPVHYLHPRTLRPLFGTLIMPCTILLPTDMYSSCSGDWEPCPFPGIILECVIPSVVWVRPEEYVIL